MHHGRVGRGVAKFFLGQSVAVEIFALARHQLPVHALALQAQHHHHINAAQALFHVGSRGDSERFNFGRYQRARADRANFRGAERFQRVNLRARHARVQQVADDRDFQPLNFSLDAANREHVQHRLRRVRVAAVAGVDDAHMRRQMFRD